MTASTPCAFLDLGVDGAEATADYCYEHQSFDCPLPLAPETCSTVKDPPGPAAHVDHIEEFWGVLPPAPPHVELNTGGRRDADSDLPGWSPWVDEDGTPLP